MVGRNKKSYKVTYLTPYSKGRHGVAVSAYTARDAIKKVHKETPSATKVKVIKGYRGSEHFDYGSGKVSMKVSKFRIHQRRR